MPEEEGQRVWRVTLRCNMKHIYILFVLRVDIRAYLYQHVDKFWITMVTGIVQGGKATIHLLAVSIVLLVLQHLLLRQNVNLGAFRYFGGSIYPLANDYLIVSCHLIFETFLVILRVDKEVRRVVGRL